MPEIRPVGASSKINMLIHSDIGVGKTTLIGTLGAASKVLIMRPPIDHADPIVGSGVQEMEVRDWPDIFEGLEYMRHDGHEWDWFGIDSISLLQDIGLDDVYEGVLASKGGRTGERAKYGPDRGEYRVNMWRLEQFVRYMVGAGVCNLIITAHSHWYEPYGVEDASAELWPWIQGKQMPQKICGMMNLVGYYQVLEREVRGEKRLQRVLHTNKSSVYYAKNQFTGAFGESGDIWNPTMPDILSKIDTVRGAAALARRGRRTTATRPAGRRSGRSR